MSPIVGAVITGAALLWAVLYAIFRFRKIESRQVRTTELLEEIQKFAIRESQARAEPSLNVTVKSKPLHVSLGHDGVSRWVIETRVQVQNNGRESVCVPAVYVSARALVDVDALSKGDRKYYESQFDNLPHCGELTDPRNVARQGKSIIQVAPGEIEHYVRWDLLDGTFAEEFPVLVFNVQAFGAAHDLLGFGRNLPDDVGPLRRPWLNFMAEDQRRHESVLFDRCEKGFTVPAHAYGGTQDAIFGERDRVLIDCSSGKVDEINSARFQEMLRTVVQWSRQYTVVLPRPGEKM